MNENKTHSEGQSGLQTQGEVTKTTLARATGSTKKVRGDGSATLARLEDRYERTTEKAVEIAARIENQKARVNERRNRANAALANRAEQPSS